MAQGDNHIDVVERAKKILNDRGIKTENVGPCGPFQIINLAAWILSKPPYNEKVGLLDKPNGNHCEWPTGSGKYYSVDWLLYPDGTGGDMLIQSETVNKPTWHLEGPYPQDVSRWRAPIDPGFPVDEPNPEPVPDDLKERVVRLESLTELLKGKVVEQSESIQDLYVKFADLRTQIDHLQIQLDTLRIPTGVKASVKIFGANIPISASLTY